MNMLPAIITPTDNPDDTVKLSDVVMIAVGSGNSEYNLSNLKHSGVLGYLLNYNDAIGGLLDSAEENTISAMQSIIEYSGGTCKSFNPTITKQQDAKSFDDSLDNMFALKALMTDYIEKNQTEICGTAALIANIIMARSEIITPIDDDNSMPSNPDFHPFGD